MTAEGKPAKQTPLDRAVAGFAWVVRQVRLHAGRAGGAVRRPRAAGQRAAAQAPARRWSGRWCSWRCWSSSASTRTRRPACRAASSSAPTRRASSGCGRAASLSGGTACKLVLFDPRDGPAAARPRRQGRRHADAGGPLDPAVLGQLKIDKLAYDVTPEQAKAATVGRRVPAVGGVARGCAAARRCSRQPLAGAAAARPGARPHRRGPACHRAGERLQKSGDGKAEGCPRPPGATCSCATSCPKEEGGERHGRAVRVRSLRRGSYLRRRHARPRCPRPAVRARGGAVGGVPGGLPRPEQFGFDRPLGQRLRGDLRRLLPPGRLNEPEHRLGVADSSAAGSASPCAELVPDPPLLMAARVRLQQADEKELMMGSGVNEWVRKGDRRVRRPDPGEGGPDEGEG